MKKNNSKKGTKQKYVAPKIIKSFLEKELLKKSDPKAEMASSPPAWQVHPPE